MADSEARSARRVLQNFTKRVAGVGCRKMFLVGVDLSEKESHTLNWLSIWRVLFRTFFYVAPKIFALSGREKSASCENLERPEKPNIRTMSRSLGNSRNSLFALYDSPYSSQSQSSSSLSDSLDCPSTYSSFENGINYRSASFMDLPHGSPRSRSYSMSDNSSIRYESPERLQKYKTSSPQYKSMNSEEKQMEMRQRSHSFSYPVSRYSDTSDGEEIDLDVHISTPYSEQWNQKHYLSPDIPEIIAPNESPTKEAPKKYFGNLKSNEHKTTPKSNCRLNIPSNPTTSDDEDEITPEVKYVGILMNDHLFRRQTTDEERTANNSSLPEEI